MAAVARRDAAAFRILVERRSAFAHRLAYRLLGDADEAEDVVQEAFVKLWTGARGWSPGRPGAVAVWLRRVVTNQCLDRMRRRKRLSDEPVPERPDETPGAEAVVVADGIALIAQRAVAALPDRQRVAIVLTYYEELPNAAAAETMQLSVGAFESLLVRARTALKRIMAEAGLGAADVGGAA